MIFLHYLIVYSHTEPRGTLRFFMYLMNANFLRVLRALRGEFGPGAVTGCPVLSHGQTTEQTSEIIIGPVAFGLSFHTFHF